MIPVQIDSANQKFIDVSNVRITVKQNGWNGSYRHLTIRAYTGQGNSINMGPEIPITAPVSTLDDDTLLQMFGGVLALTTS
jgi:hypothetical protein